MFMLLNGMRMAKSFVNGDNVYEGCICGSGFLVNFDAAMGRYPSTGDKGMCCCRAEGLDCVLNVLGIGPYTHDYVNENPEPNPQLVYTAHCAICGKDCDRNYWDSLWKVVKLMFAKEW